MKNNVLSLIVGATLVLPTMAMAAPVNNSDLMPADKRNAPVKSTIQAEIEGPSGELRATQPGAVDADMDREMNDERHNMSAPMNNNMAQPSNNNMGNTMNNTRVLPAANVSQDTRTQSPNMQHSSSDYQPLIAGEAATENKVADAASTLQEKKKDKRGELLATQPANVQFKENRRIAVNR
ncbi:hypothetical protein [Psychrobacter pocilloporae]|uniref:hypothetical protein n=1 Tax=Psychrobacter pocilloporae TaxID=1775882 RepID=UPI003C2BCBDE